MFILFIYKLYKKNESLDTFIILDTNKEDLLISNLNQIQKQNMKPVSIQYQIPVSENQLTDKDLHSIDSDILRNVRVLKTFSINDELDFYQIYSIIQKLVGNTYQFSFTSETGNDASISKIKDNEKLIAINSGAINNTNLDLFTRLKLELISIFNNLIIKNEFYVDYHPYHFFKIINSNMISITKKDNGNGNGNGNNTNTTNYVFTLTFARENKYQQFIIYYDIDLYTDGNSTNTSSTLNYIALLNKVELIGIPIPNTIEFHKNQKTENVSGISDATDTTDATDTQLQDIYYKNQVSDSASFDVLPIGDKTRRFNSSSIKYIDATETSDMDSNLFNISSLSSQIENKIMNVAKDQQYNNHRCYGLVNGASKELPQYKNPVFCNSFHPEINQNGIWDAPCQVNSDCPFYGANKNYPNEFGKCDKPSGQCEMPLGIVPIGFTQFG